MANEAIRLIGSGRGIGEQEARDGALDLRELWRALRRRKWVLITTVVVVTSAAYLYISNATPLYTARAQLHVKDRDAQVIEMEGVVEEMVADTATIQSEMQLLQSRDFLRRVATQLNLIADPEFNAELRPYEPSIFEALNPIQYIPDSFWAYLEGDTEAPPSSGLDPEVRTMNGVVDALSGRVGVSQIGDSYVLGLNLSSEDPIKAARLVNAMAEEYLVAQVEIKYQTAERASQWLGERIEQLRGEVLESEAKIVEYRSRNNIVETENSNPVTMQLTQLNTQLALSQAQRAEAEARLSQVRGLLNSEGGAEMASKVLSSPLMAELRTQETSVIRRISEVAGEIGERHPTMLSLRSDLESVREKMSDEVQRVIQDYENEVAVARAREAEIQRSLARLQEDATQFELAGVELGNLTREAEANREMFQAFITRFREIVEQQELQAADARILSTADVPNKPSYPRTSLITMIAFAGSLVVGVLLVFAIERWDSEYGFRSADEVQSAIGLRALALVPDLSRRSTHGIAAEDYVLQKPNSSFSEALQRIRTNLFLSEGGEPPKTVLITSSVPLEGKSTIAAALARQSARSGLKVILIDADLRRPRLHEVIGFANQNGLSEVLTGRANPEAAIKRDDKSGLDFLPAGVGVVSPPDLFRSSTMRILLEEMAAYYDLVIIDSPPVAAVSDSFTLSSLVDRSIYVVRWAQTPRNVVLAGLRQMAEAGAEMAGVVLSRVDVTKHARYGYADSGYYEGYYRKYYVN
jgi:succinoglycan biosynthesis transport protein ExoP